MTFIINCTISCKDDSIKCDIDIDIDIENESQIHIFTNCQPVLSKLTHNNHIEYQDIYGNVYQQKGAITLFVQINQERIGAGLC